MTTWEWEKRPSESTAACRAFSLFRDLGPGRTLREVAAILYGEGYRSSTRRVPGRLKQWSADNDWVERAQALDARDDAIRLEAVEMHKLREADDTAERVKALREQNLANEERAARIEAKLLDRAERLVDELPLKNAVLDAARLHKMATRNEPSRADFRTYDLSKATDDQLRRIAAGEDPARVLGEDWPAGG